MLNLNKKISFLNTQLDSNSPILQENRRKTQLNSPHPTSTLCELTVVVKVDQLFLYFQDLRVQELVSLGPRSVQVLANHVASEQTV